MAKTIYVPNEWLESKAAAVEDDADALDEVLVGLCMEEVQFLLDRIGASSSDRLIIMLWCRGFSDKEIAEGLAKYFPARFGDATLWAVTKQRQRIIYRMNKTAGADLGLITVLRDAFKRNVQ